MQHLKDSQGDSPCYNCGTDENPIWFTDDVFWNNVMGKLRYKVFCINCFTVRAEKKYKVMWRLIPDWKWQKRKPKA